MQEIFESINKVDIGNISHDAIEYIEDESLIPEEDVIVTITNKGYIKRMRVDAYKAQKRGGKGITGTKMQGDDFVERVLFTSSHDNLLFFTNLGKVITKYIVIEHCLPERS